MNNALEKERSRAANCSYVIAFGIVRMESLYLTCIVAQERVILNVVYANYLHLLDENTAMLYNIGTRQG